MHSIVVVVVVNNHTSGLTNRRYVPSKKGKIHAPMIAVVHLYYGPAIPRTIKIGSSDRLVGGSVARMNIYQELSLL